jgi:hypothetical protein
MVGCCDPLAIALMAAPMGHKETFLQHPASFLLHRCELEAAVEVGRAETGAAIGAAGSCRGRNAHAASSSGSQNASTEIDIDNCA